MLNSIGAFFVLGVALGALYDVFRFFRFVFSKKLMVFINDFVYCLVFALCFFTVLLAYNNGRVRMYFVFAVFAGFFAYVFTVFRFTEPFQKKVSYTVVKTFKKVLHFVKTVYYNTFVLRFKTLRKTHKKEVENSDENIFSEFEK